MTQPPLRVVVLTTYFAPVMGGVESNAERLACYLARAGCTVRVLTKRVTPDLADVEVRDGFTVHRIGPRGARSPAGKWQFAPAAARWLVREAATSDVVACIDFRGVGAGALAARAVTARPVVFQAQTHGVLTGQNAAGAMNRVGLRPERWAGRAVAGAITGLYRRADAFACISRSIQKETIAAGVPPERVHFLPNPVDMQRFRPARPEERDAARAALGIAPEQLVCIFVGRLSLEKGILDLMEAWRLLLTELPNPRSERTDPVLVVAGPDMHGHRWDAGPAARELAQRLGFAHTVRFIGPTSDVAGVLHVADLSVMPSHFEALGLSAIEALATGLPVIASAVDGLLEVVHDEVNGLRCPPQSPPALAASLRRLLHDHDLRRRLAANARSSMAEYDERIVFARFHDLLSGLAHRAAESRGTRR